MIVVVLPFIITIAPRCRAQYFRGNAFAQVEVDRTTGKFIAFELLPDSIPIFYGNKFTSHTNFVMRVNGTQQIYTNENASAFPVNNGITTLPASIYMVQDTVFAAWPSLHGFSILQLAYPVYTAGSGAIAIEYRCEKIDSTSTNSLIGIAMELDLNTVDTTAACNGYGDRVFFQSTNGYNGRPSADSAPCWSPLCWHFVSPNIPPWFRVTSWNPASHCIQCPEAMGYLANLPGSSEGIPALVPPDEIFVGDWGDVSRNHGLKNVGWIVGAADFDSTSIYQDGALLYKWNVRSDTFRCCTMFGPPDPTSDGYHCANENTVVDFRFPALHHRMFNEHAQQILDTIMYWFSSVRADSQPLTRVVAMLDTGSIHVHLLPGEDASKFLIAVGGNSNTLVPFGSGMCQWILQIDTSTCNDESGPTVLVNPLHVAMQSLPVTLPITCGPPLLQYECWKTFRDSIPPFLRLDTTVRNFVKMEIIDSGRYFSGIDSIWFAPKPDFNLNPPPNFTCTESLAVTGLLINNISPRDVRIFMRDCAGNVGSDSLSFSYLRTAVAERHVPLFDGMIAAPEPFSTLSTLEFSIPDDASGNYLSVSLFNALGTRLPEKHLQLINEGGGQYRCSVDGHLLPTGMYVLVVSTREKILRQIIHLVK